MPDKTVETMFERCLNGDGGSVWLRWQILLVWWWLQRPSSLEKGDRFPHQSGCPIPTTTFPQSIESRSIGGPFDLWWTLSSSPTKKPVMSYQCGWLEFWLFLELMPKIIINGKTSKKFKNTGFTGRWHHHRASLCHFIVPASKHKQENSLAEERFPSVSFL